MKIHNSRPPWTRILCLMALLLPLTGGCSGMKKFEWTEELELSGGKVVTVQRMAEYRPVMDVGAGFQRGLLFDNASLSADLPAPVSRQVHWVGVGLSPRVIDVLPNGMTYLVCSVQTAFGQGTWQVPDYEFYVAFVLDGNDWRRVALADLPPQIKKPNLLVVEDTVFIVNKNRSPAHFDLKTKYDLNAKYALERSQKEIWILPKSFPTKP